MDRREIRQLDLARVDQDQFCAALANRLLHLQADDRMRLRGVASGHQKDIGQMHICDGVGHRARTQCRGQTGHGAGVSEPRAVIDVVRTDQSARHLLQEIIFLVRAFG